MSDPLDQVLRLVAEGRLTAAEAAPILDALGAADADRGSADRPHGPRADTNGADASNETGDDRSPGPPKPPTALRIEVTEGGRQIVNLRIPVNLGPHALDRIPGLSESTVDLIRRALDESTTGPLLAIDDEGEQVRIALE